MGEVIAFHPHLSPVATALADEGVPIRVISRSMRIPAEDMRTHLKEAQERGELIDLPSEDWPATARRQDRLPVSSQAAELDRLTCSVRAVFKVTAQQAVVFAALLTRNELKKEQLLAAIQAQRVSRPNLPIDLDEPQIKLIDVVICNLRKRLKKHGVQIDTMWGRGYSISRVNRELALKLIAEYNLGEATVAETPDAEAGHLETEELARAA